MPRLDWQMWFAALAGDCRAAPWFLRFEQRLLSGTPEVLALLRENPFPDRPPRYIRARLSLYTFTRWGSHDWWASEDVGLFCPPMGSPRAGMRRATVTARREDSRPDRCSQTTLRNCRS